MNCLDPDISAACVKLRTKNYDPRVKILADKMQQQVSYQSGK